MSCYGEASFTKRKGQETAVSRFLLDLLLIRREEGRGLVLRKCSHQVDLSSFYLLLQVEVIGGAEKYLAVCRACFKPDAATSPMCSPANRNKVQTSSPSKRGGAEKRRLFGNIENSMENTMETA